MAEKIGGGGYKLGPAHDFTGLGNVKNLLLAFKQALIPHQVSSDYLNSFGRFLSSEHPESRKGKVFGPMFIGTMLNFKTRAVKTCSHNLFWGTLYNSYVGIVYLRLLE